MAAEGLRVLGVAKAHLTRAQLPSKQHDFDFNWVGLVGLADPVRPGVPQAIKDCQAAGVRVIMMTGDHPQTAQWIGRQIGFGADVVVVTGSELDQLSDFQLRETVRQVQIFSRVRPEQKLRIVEALRSNGEVVAMTGDGVNDAPALRGAQVGIAMGGRGTDVAREASSLVLLDDDFASIVDAIRMGRRIYTNIQSAFVYLLAVHIPIAGMSVLPVFLNLPLVLLPVHIAFLHLIIEPVCSIVFEAEPSSPEQMKKPPRHPNSPLLTHYQLTSSLIQGTSILFTLMAIYIFSLYRGQGEDDARALTFTSLVFSNLTLILTSRTLGSKGVEKNQWTTGVILGSLVLLIAVLYLPELRQVFRFSYLHPLDWLICLVAGGVSVLWLALLNRLRR
jgi:Ca2+-transporting ATPase